MICEVCHEAIATVHLTEIVNNAKKEIHLCEACAEQKGVAIHSHVKDISIPEFFGQLVDPKDDDSESWDDLECEPCGITFRQFRQNGKLGCPNCYDAFRSEINPLLRKIHSIPSGPVRHRGKVPTRIDDVMKSKRELEELKEELTSAVAGEEYELAATLRDKIHELERETWT